MPPFVPPNFTTRPEIIGTAYAGGIASDLRLHPVMPTGKLCGGSP